MRSSLLALPCGALLALLAASGCTASSSEGDDGDHDDAQRTSMRSSIEGTWTGTYTFTDKRAATTMTLALRYTGSGQSKPQCGSRVLSTGEPELGPRCMTIYSMPVGATLTTADGARTNTGGTLTFDNVEGLTGTIAEQTLQARIVDGKLEGTFEGSGDGSFKLTRAQ